MLDLILVDIDDPKAVLVAAELSAHGRRDHDLERVVVEAARVAMKMSAKHFAHAGSRESLQKRAPLLGLDVEVDVGRLVRMPNEQGYVLKHDEMFVLAAITCELHVEPFVLLATTMRHVTRVEVELRVERYEFAPACPEREVVVAEIARVRVDRLVGGCVAHVVVAAHAYQLDLLVQFG